MTKSAVLWSLRNLNKDSRVFRYGDHGDKFYIILEGSVSVSIPMKVQLEQEEDGHEGNTLF